MQPKGRDNFARCRAYSDKHKPKGKCFCLQCECQPQPSKARQRRIDRSEIKGEQDA